MRPYFLRYFDCMFCTGVYGSDGITLSHVLLYTRRSIESLRNDEAMIHRCKNDENVFITNPAYY